MRLSGILFIISLAGFAAPQAPDGPKEFEPLLAYQGTWQVSRTGAANPDTLINRCSVLGQFFVCAQNVNGQPGNLVVFLRHGDAGHYHVQNIMASGRATGITDLQIGGDTWVYSSRQDQNGATTYYKTTNVFTGKNKIRFESAHSSNGKDFSVDASGNEVKLSK